MLAIIDAPIGMGIGLTVLALLAVSVLPIWFMWRALDRAGLSGPLALLGIVPLGLFVVMGVLAFARWPNLPEPTDNPYSSL
jgi:hypothetical protein